MGKQYEQSKAVDRVSAARGGGWRIEPDPAGGQRPDGSWAALRVAFGKGAGSGRGEHVDAALDALSLEATSATLAEILGDPGSREMLRPENMALCSPRVFWAVLRWGNAPRPAASEPATVSSLEGCLQGGPGSFDAEACLALLVPAGDWSFLSSRTRQRSEKAEENARQLEAEAEEGGVELEILPVSLAAPSSLLEPVAASPPKAPGPSARDRALAAAERRMSSSGIGGGGGSAAGGATCKGVVGEEEVTSAAEEGKNSEEGVSEFEEIVGQKWAALMRAKPSVLGGAGPCTDEDLISRLADIQDRASLAANLAAAASNEDVGQGNGPLDVENWVVSARDFEVDRVLHDIVAAGVAEQAVDPTDLVGWLSGLRVRTVRDLKLLAKRPAMLRSMLTRHLTTSFSDEGLSAHGAAAKAAALVMLLDDAIIGSWMHTAVALCSRRPWLDDWVTAPVTRH